ncbi:unnamed protein product [Cochlearia groenlandica]
MAEGFTEENKMAFTYGFMEGEALLWFEQHDEFTRWSEIKTGLVTRFGTGKEAERFRDWAEIRRVIDQLKLTLIASKKLSSHEDQSQLDENVETNPAKADLLVPRGVDTLEVGSVCEEHIEPNLAKSG